MDNTDRDREDWTDEQWPKYKKARGDGYKAWNGKGHRLNGTDPGSAAYDITQQAVSEGICEPDHASENGYYMGATRGLRGQPLEGATNQEEGK